MLDLRVVGGCPVRNQTLSSFILVYKLSDLSHCYRIENISHIQNFMRKNFITFAFLEAICIFKRIVCKVIISIL